MMCRISEESYAERVLRRARAVKEWWGGEEGVDIGRDRAVGTDCRRGRSGREERARRRRIGGS